MPVVQVVTIGAACLLIMGAAALRADEPASAAPAAQSSAPKEASIPFADRNIWNWQVIDNQTVLIESNSHRWYQAKLLSPCTDLPFTERVGFKSNADGSFDKFSTIIARGQSCQLLSLTQTPKPAKKGAKKAATEPPKAN